MSPIEKTLWGFSWAKVKRRYVLDDWWNWPISHRTYLKNIYYSRNKCNRGYASINFVDYADILSFYDTHWQAMEGIQEWKDLPYHLRSDTGTGEYDEQISEFSSHGEIKNIDLYV